jgi:hypothetical protein
VVNTIIRKATLDEITYVCNNMRQSDKLEIWASHRRKPQDAAKVCCNANPYIVLINDFPSIIFGCSDNGINGTPWLLSTQLIQTIGVRFIRGSKAIVEGWLNKHEYLENFVHAKNEISVQWLKWLGFSFEETIVVNDEPFTRFIKRRDEYV